MLEVNPSDQSLSSRDPNDIEDLFEVFFTSHGRANKAIKMEGGIGWRPATDVYETEDMFIVQVDLAGMRRENIEVLVEEDVLILKGVRSGIAPAGKKHFHKMEIMVGPFERHIRIPDHVDGTTASARYESGFLFVKMGRGKGRCHKRQNVRIES